MLGPAHVIYGTQMRSIIGGGAILRNTAKINISRDDYYNHVGGYGPFPPNRFSLERSGSNSGLESVGPRLPHLRN